MPARYEFVKKHFSVSSKTEYSIEFETYLNKTLNKNFSLVFSSYYLGNPSSIFGHIFFALDSQDSRVLDYAVNYTAQTGNEGFFTYVLKGLSGKFPSKFGLINFYDKIREYNDIENRDLWVYHLDLNEDQKKILVYHLWELSQLDFNYYFFTKNCAYQAAFLFDPISSKISLSKQMNYFSLPNDTIKIFIKEFKISHIEYRASMRSIFLAKYNELNRKQRIDFQRIHTTMKLDSTIDKKTVNALIAYYNYKYFTGKLNRMDNDKGQEIFKFKKDLIKINSQNDEDETIIPSSKMPHLIHDTRRISLYGYRRLNAKINYCTLEFRFAYHDMSDSSKGYPSGTEIEILKISEDFQISEEKNKQLKFNEFQLLKMTSLNDFSRWEKSLSWTFSISYKRNEVYEINRLCPTIFSGFGLSKSIIQENSSSFLSNMVIYAMPCFELLNREKKEIQFYYGGFSGLIFSLMDNTNFILSFKKMYSYKNNSFYQLDAKTSFNFSDFCSYSIMFQNIKTETLLKSGISIYF